MLFDEARKPSRAADYFLLAAQNAAQLFAHHEVVMLARRGLSMLAKLPDTPERARKEITSQITLGPALIATKGQGDLERTATRTTE